MPTRSSELTSVELLASSVSLAAKDSRPIFVAR